ncbi:hypothetical protein [Butyrivibrio proteoclasticus]|nr:hypothetical protein [Butyrivibrio proteoclasticus]
MFTDKSSWKPAWVAIIHAMAVLIAEITGYVFPVTRIFWDRPE